MKGEEVGRSDYGVALFRSIDKAVELQRHRLLPKSFNMSAIA